MLECLKKNVLKTECLKFLHIIREQSRKRWPDWRCRYNAGISVKWLVFPVRKIRTGRANEIIV